LYIAVASRIMGSGIAEGVVEAGTPELGKAAKRREVRRSIALLRCTQKNGLRWLFRDRAKDTAKERRAGGG